MDMHSISNNVVMQTNEELAELLRTQITTIETAAIALLGTLAEPLTADTMQQSPAVDTLIFYLLPIVSVEDEMRKRGILEDTMEGIILIDYEKERMLVYDDYRIRFEHLLYMQQNGYLDPVNVHRVSMECQKKAYTQNNEDNKKEKEEETEETMPHASKKYFDA